jgi:hypothetical protein
MAYAAKAIFRESGNIEQFAKTYGIGRGQTFMFTLTFKDNVISKAEASKRWNVLLTNIKKKLDLFRFVLVWERQKRGSWHCHLLCNAPVTMKKFKQVVRDFIDVSGINFGFIHARWTSGKDFKGVSIYLSKYLQKEHREKGVRYVSYSQNWIRRVKGSFSFVGGKAQIWRRSCSTLDSMFPDSFRYFYKHADFNTKQLAVESLNGTCSDFLRKNMMWNFFNKHHGVTNRARTLFNTQLKEYAIKWLSWHDSEAVDKHYMGDDYFYGRDDVQPVQQKNRFKKKFFAVFNSAGEKCSSDYKWLAPQLQTIASNLALYSGQNYSIKGFYK